MDENIVDPPDKDKNLINVSVNLSSKEKKNIIEFLKNTQKIYPHYKDFIMDAINTCGDKVSVMDFDKTEISINIKLTEEELIKLKNKCYEKGFLRGLKPAISNFIRACILCFIGHQPEPAPQAVQSGAQGQQPEPQPGPVLKQQVLGGGSESGGQSKEKE